jgi:hypothetical protein
LESQNKAIPTNLNNSLGAYILSDSINEPKGLGTGYKIFDLEKSFILSSVPDSTRLNNKINLNLAILNQSSNVDNTLPNLLNLSIINNLNIAKESRWFLKNSPITERLGIANFSYTQAKNLIGSPLTQSSKSDSSV